MSDVMWKIREVEGKISQEVGRLHEELGSRIQGKADKGETEDR